MRDGLENIIDFYYNDKGNGMKDNKEFVKVI